MDNKLGELSKPVATVDVQRGHMDGNTFAVAWSSAGHALPDGPHFIYSQEYVSALLARIAELEQVPTIKHMRAVEGALISATDRASEWERKAISNFDDCASMSQRIAELEAIRADASQVFKEIGNELGCNPDNESIMMAIDDLKKDNASLRGQRAGLVQAASELGAKLAESRETTLLVRDEWQKDKARADEAEKRLATPVRLPRTFWYEHDDLAHEIPVLEKKKVVAAICGAGFTVEGDE
ncbi:hypothetical protein ACRA7N_19855 [Serratia nematodiphila]